MEPQILAISNHSISVTHLKRKQTFDEVRLFARAIRVAVSLAGKKLA